MSILRVMTKHVGYYVLMMILIFFFRSGVCKRVIDNLMRSSPICFDVRGDSSTSAGRERRCYCTKNIHVVFTFNSNRNCNCCYRRLWN